MQGIDRAAAVAAAMLNFRRARSKILPAELFAEPAWDLLLALFIADAEGHRITAREVSLQSAVPPTVLARWMLHLTKIGFIIGDGDGDLDDQLTLTAKALDSMERAMAIAENLMAVMF